MVKILHTSQLVPYIRKLNLGMTFPCPVKLGNEQIIHVTTGDRNPLYHFPVTDEVIFLLACVRQNGGDQRLSFCERFPLLWSPRF